MSEYPEPERSRKQPNFPGAVWQQSSPEAQGIDTQTLVQMFGFIRENRKNLNSIVLIRNGILAMEAYFSPHSQNTLHDIASVTKSVTSMLIGVALEQGYLKGVTERAAELIPKELASEIDQSKGGITVEHLLGMTSGLAWNETEVAYGSPNNTLTQMSGQDDWLHFITSRPVRDEPGRKFTYNSGGYHLLSAILQHQVGMSAADFARDQLFAPLGIMDYYWPSDPNGITRGSSRLRLSAQSLARLGYLYLHHGRWGEHQIVPSSYVEASTHKRVDLGSEDPMRNPKWQLFRRIGRKVRSLPYLGYGYGWFVPSFGGFAARGYAGQAIFVHPETQLVTVFTGCLQENDSFLPEYLMSRFVLPSLSSKARVERSDASGSLDQILRKLAQVKPVLVRPIPAPIRSISGQQFLLEPNASGLQWFRLSFETEGEGLLELFIQDHLTTVVIGLDLVFRLNYSSDSEWIGVRGTWLGEHKFAVETRSTVTGNIFQMLFQFGKTRVVLHTREWLSGKSERFVAHHDNP